MHRFILSLAVLLLPLSTGCVIPEFQNPLSDADSTMVDPRVIGYWQQFEIDDDGKEKTTSDDDVFHNSAIFGKHADLEDSMIIARTVLDDDGTVEHESRVAKATKLGDHHYFSWTLKDEEVGKDDSEKVAPLRPPVFYITRYHLSDHNQKLTMYLLDPDQIVEALQEGRLAGVVEEEVKIKNGKETSEVTRIVIESTTADLRDFFLKFGDTLFNTDEPIYYRKRTPPK